MKTYSDVRKTGYIFDRPQFSLFEVNLEEKILVEEKQNLQKKAEISEILFDVWFKLDTAINEELVKLRDVRTFMLENNLVVMKEDQ